MLTFEKSHVGIACALTFTAGFSAPGLQCSKWVVIRAPNSYTRHDFKENTMSSNQIGDFEDPAPDFMLDYQDNPLRVLG